MGSRGRRKRGERGSIDRVAKQKTGDEKRVKDESERTAYDPELDREAGIPSVFLRNLSFKNLLALITRSRYAQLLLLLILSGAFLRLYNLSYNSLWLDEATTLDISRHSYLEIFDIVSRGEVNPPLFYWIEHAMLFFGDSEFVLRIVPAMAGILTIPVFYLLGKELIDRNTGVIAAALVTFSPFHLFYSQEARAYSLMLFFFSVCLLFFFRGWRMGAWRDWVLFGLFAALGFWTHFYVFTPVAILMLAGLGLAFTDGAFHLKKLKNALLSIGVFIVATVPLLVIALQIFLYRTSSPRTFGIAGVDMIYQTLLQISGYNQFLLLAFLILFGIGIALLFLRDSGKAILIAILVVVPLIVSVQLSNMMPMLPRYLIYLLPMYFIGIASTVTLSYRRLDVKLILHVVVILVFLVAIPFYLSYYTSYSKEDWRGFNGILSSITSRGDVVVAVPSYMRIPLDYYYSNYSDETIEYGALNASNLYEIWSIHKDRRIVYVMTADIFPANPEGDAYRWLMTNTTYITSHSGIHVLVRVPG